jgi:hypothetical protein
MPAMRQFHLWAIALLSTFLLSPSATLANPSLFLTPQSMTGMSPGSAQGGIQKMAIVGLNQPFSLPLNARAMVKREGLRMEFLTVQEDSRCPTGLDCFWSGRAVVVVNLIKNGKSLGIVELTHSPNQSPSQRVAGYSLQLVELSPYPVSGQTRTPSAYVGTFRISRSPQS